MSASKRMIGRDHLLGGAELPLVVVQGAQRENER